MTFKKPAGDTLDYVANWATWLDTDTIATSGWSGDTGITVGSSSNTTTTATVNLSGGTEGRTYKVTNTITTAGGRTATVVLEIEIKPRYH